MLEAVGTDVETGTMWCAPDAPTTDRVTCEPPRLKVLLVEDNASTSVMIERCLNHIASFEPQITVAGSLKAAQFALGADDFDVVLIDDAMLKPENTHWLLGLGDAQDGCARVLLTGTEHLETASMSGDGTAAARLAKDNLSPKRLETSILSALRDHAGYCTRAALSSENLGWETA